LKPQDYHPGEGNKIPSVRMPPAGTVPVGFKPYPYKGNAAAAVAALKNPIAGDLSPEILERGRVKFETYCAVCHGYEGKGDGPVAPKMALKPPTLLSDKILKMNDGGIFHIVTDGQGVMASYLFQLPEERDRWALVNYVRSLQKLAGAPSGAAGKKAK
jgi:mono/diheme cytochrome c family protein